MLKLKTRLLSAFPADPSGGNIGGVVYEKEILETSERQQIATDIAVSTTGFVRDIGGDVFEVRFHSSTAEMAMCGHVTIAVFSALHADKKIDCGHFTQRTSAGDLKIEIANDGTISMLQPSPKFSEHAVKFNELAPLLGLSDSNFNDPLFSSTALKHLFIEVPDRAALASLKLDDEGLRTFSQHNDIDTIGVWCPLLIEKGFTKIQLRDLCHGVGDPEEAASGTTNGALASLLFKTGRVKADDNQEIKQMGWQGIEMGRPSYIETRLKIDDQFIKEVKVGGKADLRLTGTYHLKRNN